MLDNIRVSSEDITRIADTISAFLNATNSDANFSEGTVLHDLIVMPMATVIAAIEGDTRYLEKRLSLDFLIDEETESAATMMDQLASNFFVTRNNGARTEGVVNLLLSNNDSFTIPIGTVFEKSIGVEFVYDSSEPLVVGSDDMETETDSLGVETGNYIASVYVIGARDSVGSGLNAGDFSSMTNPPKNLVRIYNDVPFTIAESQEPNSVFAERIKQALTHRGFNTQASISTVIMDNIESVKRVSVVGAGHPAMQRDLLTIGTANAVHTLGMINIIADTGFSSVITDRASAEGYSFASIKSYGVDGTEIPIRSELPDGITTYGDVSVQSLPEDNEYRLDVESKWAYIHYSDPNYARTLDQDVSITSSESISKCSILAPKAILAVDTYISNESIAPLGTDLQTYYPSVKLLDIQIVYIRRAGVPEDEFPEAFIQSSTRSYISNIQNSGQNLSVSGLHSYISSTFSAFIAGIDTSRSYLKYSILLPNGSQVFYEVESTTEISKSRSYYIDFYLLNGVISSRTVYDHVSTDYLYSLQIDDDYCSLECSPADIKLVEA